MDSIKLRIIFCLIFCVSKCLSEATNIRQGDTESSESKPTRVFGFSPISKGNTLIRINAVYAKGDGELYSHADFGGEPIAEFGFSVQSLMADFLAIGFSGYYSNINGGPFKGGKFGLGPDFTLYINMGKTLPYAFLDVVPSIFRIIDADRFGLGLQLNYGISLPVSGKLSINTAFNYNLATTFYADLSSVGLGGGSQKSQFDTSGSTIGLYLGIGIFFFRG